MITAQNQSELRGERAKNKKGEVRPPPFDSYCPSMIDKLDQCICNVCGLSWPSAAAKNRHVTAHGIEQYSIVEPNVTTTEVSDEFETETGLADTMTGNETMPIIQNLAEHLVSPFEQIFDEISA